MPAEISPEIGDPLDIDLVGVEPDDPAAIPPDEGDAGEVTS